MPGKFWGSVQIIFSISATKCHECRLFFKDLEYQCVQSLWMNLSPGWVVNMLEMFTPYQPTTNSLIKKKMNKFLQMELQQILAKLIFISSSSSWISTYFKHKEYAARLSVFYNVGKLICLQRVSTTWGLLRFIKYITACFIDDFRAFILIKLFFKFNLSDIIYLSVFHS